MGQQNCLPHCGDSADKRICYKLTTTHHVLKKPPNAVLEWPMPLKKEALISSPLQALVQRRYGFEVTLSIAPASQALQKSYSPEYLFQNIENIQ